MEHQRPLIVISATNLVEAGPLSVLKDCLAYASSGLSGRFRIIALVHNRELFGELPNIEFMEFPLAKRSWFIRLFHEWFVFNRLSRRLKPFLWFSLHDLTPRVQAQRRAVYCHNPAMFYPLTLAETVREPVFAAFHTLYPLVYRINISQNDWVIVQQEWMRKEFMARYPVRQVIVAHPSVPPRASGTNGKDKATNKKVFFFPSYPRFFKNFEVIGEASRIMMQRGRQDFEVRITLDGTENRYAKRLAHQFHDVPTLMFIGKQSRDEVYVLYGQADCLIFPSRLETWGLPLSEFKQFDKPILAANLPYAHETVGSYGQVRYFDPCDPDELALRMEEFLDGCMHYDQERFDAPSSPFVSSWKELFGVLTADGVKA